MPGLLRGVARTAVVAGTATTVSNRVSRRQAARWTEQGQQQYEQQQYEQQQRYEQEVYDPRQHPQQAYAQPTGQTVPDAMSGRIEQLRQLGELKAQGVLTEAEFEHQKAMLLNS